MFKNIGLLIMALLTVAACHGQVPQFSSSDFADWVYTNPGIEVNQDNILANRIVLYTDNQGRQLTLISPRFDVRTGQTIDLSVTWVTRFWQSEEFVVYKAGFTAAIINQDGVAVDSVTFTPTSLRRENQVNLSLTVSHGMRNARLRLASWKADIVSSGAVRSIEATSYFKADVNLDGEVSLADANAVIDIIVGGTQDDELARRADVNGDGEISLADINAVIDVIVG